MLHTSEDEDSLESEKEKSEMEHGEDQEPDASSPSFSPESTDIVTPEEMESIRKKTARKGKISPFTSPAD